MEDASDEAVFALGYMQQFLKQVFKHIARFSIGDEKRLCTTHRREEILMDPEEYRRVCVLRRVLHDMNAPDAIQGEPALEIR